MLRIIYKDSRCVRAGWWLFLSCAILMCITCVLSNIYEFIGRSQMIPATYWPSKSKLRTWELNTEENYTAKLLQACGSDEPVTRRYEFVVSEFNTIIAGKSRRIIGVNGQYPGPLIEAIEGDTIQVLVVNKLSDVGTSIHFHGQYMNGTNFYDGAVGVTQCGIAPGASFEYTFAAGPAGSFWYHSHSGLQALKGLIGPLIVHNRLCQPFKGDDDRNTSTDADKVVLLSDLYGEEPENLMDVYREPWLGGNTEPVPALAVVQGKTHPTIDIPRLVPVRLRIVNAASYTAFRVQLGASARKFRVIEADGTPLIPAEVDHLLIFPAQRYSIIVQLQHDDWLLTTPQLNLYDNRQVCKTLERSSSGLRALLQVAGDDSLDIPATETQILDAAAQVPSPLQCNRTALVDHYFEPSLDIIPPNATRPDMFVDLTMSRTTEGVIAGAINGKIGNPQEKGNYLATVLNISGSERRSQYQADAKYPASAHSHHAHERHYSIVLDDNDFGNTLLVSHGWTVVDIVIRNFDDGLHPMHLHGYSIWVMERGSLDSESRQEAWMKPLRRDTVVLPQNEWVRIRIVLDNPGIWLLHCHIPWHSLTGMRTSIISLPEKLAIQRPPISWWNMCK